jgi:hypothetical protein
VFQVLISALADRVPEQYRPLTGVDKIRRQRIMAQ